ncbi:asparaginase [Microtetraspora malaysiensis]|uniref:asparaginase n=1 Tax=Microtetraspora malaysiensis TaxID=161358 RepID=UPI00082F11A2|nr:asparaginase [Microtetraspora malaysiensis]
MTRDDGLDGGLGDVPAAVARVVVIATGGTIASSSDPGGAAVARRTVAQLLGAAGYGDVEVEGRDLLNLGSYLLGHRELRVIAEAVMAELARDEVTGVVVSHGTDTMEETAFLLDLVHDSGKPVVLTGAQRAADQPDSDGPRNLREAVAVAASPETRGCGALISFAGRIFSPRRTRKHHTVAAEPYRTADGGPIGRIGASGVVITALPVRPAPLIRPGPRFDGTRVDIVTVHPGADAALARAAVRAGAQAVVLAGTGVGNANHALLEWVSEAVAAGTVVGLSTRVAEGPVVPVYGNAGGADLVRAGALSMGALPLYHARLLLALLISEGVAVTGRTLAPYV